MKIVSLFILLSLMLTDTLFAQRNKDVQIKTNPITDNIYMLEGAGGNIGLLTGDDGTVMIDAQFANMAIKINTAISDLTPNPVKYLINTHWHGDHTGGNEQFAILGATIVAQDNVRTKLSNDQQRPFGRKINAAVEKAWPVLTFSEEMHLHINGEDVHLIHHHNAHTDGDAFVYFSTSNVLHMGDCFFKDRFPFVDTALGGTPDGVISAVEAALMICDQNTKIIPGHGSQATKQDLKAYHQMLLIMRDRVKSEIQNGTDQENLNFSELTKGYDSWGTGFISGEKMVKMLYNYYM